MNVVIISQLSYYVFVKLMSVRAQSSRWTDDAAAKIRRLNNEDNNDGRCVEEEAKEMEWKTNANDAFGPYIAFRDCMTSATYALEMGKP